MKHILPDNWIFQLYISLIRRLFVTLNILGVQWGPQYRYRTTRSPARCLHPMAFRNSNIERGKCVRQENSLIDPRQNMEYGPGSFIDGTKYIPLVNRDTFFDLDQVRWKFTLICYFKTFLKHIGNIQIPTTSIWDETRKSEYSQLYLDFAPYFQTLRSEIAIEPTTAASNPPSAADILLDRIIEKYSSYPPKFTIQGTYRFSFLGKRRIDLLDFFRHAFRQHVYTTRSYSSGGEAFEQQMRFVLGNMGKILYPEISMKKGQFKHSLNQFISVALLIIEFKLYCEKVLNF